MTEEVPSLEAAAASPMWRRLLGKIDLAYVVLSVGVVWLAWSNVGLIADRSALRRGLADANPGLTGSNELQANDVVPQLVAQTTDGKRVSLDYQGSPTALFVFDPRCGVCLRESPSWQALTKELRSSGAQVSWVSVADVDLTIRGLKRDGVQWPALIIPDRGFQRAYRVASVPQVAVIGQGGRVLWAHHGAMSQDDHRELRVALGKGDVVPTPGTLEQR